MKGRVCKKCDGVVFNRREIDWDGNIVWSSRCWNGHVYYIHIEGIDDNQGVKCIEKFGSRDEIVAYIGFFTHD